MTAFAPGHPRRPSLAARAALALVRFYQMLTATRPSPCRYVPTCSSYAVEALETHGFWRGGALSARRLGRCHPWARTNGWDPVPSLPHDRRNARRKGHSR